MMQQKIKGEKSRVLDFLNLHKIDIIFTTFMILLFIYYNFYISRITSPGWDGAVYLINAKNWLTNTPLYEIYRPPLLSWIIAGIWLFTGENWIIVKFLQAIFTIGAGIILYILIKNYKGSLFAFSVVTLTMLNTYVFFYSTQIFTEGLSLFFLILTLYFLKSEKPNHWFLAGISLGLTFASRYPIILQAFVILFVESFIRKNWKLFTRTIVGSIPIILIVILVVSLKTGTFQTALEKDTQFNFLLSPFYLLNSINIWGLVFLLVPIAFLFRKTYADKFNYTFIAWFIISLIFWSANTTNQQFRFIIQFTPAVYYLAILAIENMAKSNMTISDIQLRSKMLATNFSNKIKLLTKIMSPSNFNRTKFHFTLVILFWSVLIVGSPVYLNLFINAFNFGNPASPLTGYFSYIDSNSSNINNLCQINYPTEKTIILRMDDVQGWAWNKIVPNLTDTILNRNMSVTLSVIPKNIDKDPVIKSYLLSKLKDHKIEIAQHGTNHSNYEFMNLSEQETYELAKAGLEKIVNTLGVYPITFIPPNNQYNENTTKALLKLGFKVFSARQDEYKFDGNTVYVGYTKATKLTDKIELTSTKEILNSCKNSLELKNICVIMLHPQDYVNEDKITLNETKYLEFIKLLDELENLNAKFITFKEMIKC